MTETLNVNVLVAAKEEYTKQLISTIQGGVYDIIKQIYIDSQKIIYADLFHILIFKRN